MERFELLQGEGDLALYQFNTKTARHFFCRNCAPSAAYAVNVKLVNGCNSEAAQDPRLRNQSRTT